MIPSQAISEALAASALSQILAVDPNENEIEDASDLVSNVSDLNYQVDNKSVVEILQSRVQELLKLTIEQATRIQNLEAEKKRMLESKQKETTKFDARLTSLQRQFDALKEANAASQHKITFLSSTNLTLTQQLTGVQTALGIATADAVKYKGEYAKFDGIIKGKDQQYASLVAQYQSLADAYQSKCCC